MSDLTNEFNFNSKQLLSKLEKKFLKHSFGLFILAPSGVGKTTFVNNQKNNDWIDGDYIWPLSGADPLDDGWEQSISDIIEVNKRSDIVTEWANSKGYWIIGSSNDSYMPDAIVLPDWDEHKKRITNRENTNYDGGATSKDFIGVKSHREWIAKWQQKGVPKFNSIEDAVDYLTSDLIFVDIIPKRDGPIAASWINAPGGAQMLQLMGMLVPDNHTTTPEIETNTLTEIKNNKDELAWMINYQKKIVGIIEVQLKEFEGLAAPSISIMIGDSSMRGKALGTRAVGMEIIRLKNMGYKECYARVLTHNSASIKMINKVGFINDGEPYTDKDNLNWQNVKYKIL